MIGSTDLRILKAIATAYRLTGRKRFKQVLAAGLEAALAGSNPRPGRGVGKSVCARMREAPQVLAALPGKKK